MRGKVVMTVATAASTVATTMLQTTAWGERVRKSRNHYQQC